MEDLAVTIGEHRRRLYLNLQAEVSTSIEKMVISACRILHTDHTVSPVESVLMVESLARGAVTEEAADTEQE